MKSLRAQIAELPAETCETDRARSNSKHNLGMSKKSFVSRTVASKNSLSPYNRESPTIGRFEKLLDQFLALNESNIKWLT